MGYKRSEFDPQLLEPIEEYLEALEEGIAYLKTSSYPEVARWLTDYTGIRITPMGLWKRVKRDASDRRKHVEQNAVPPRPRPKATSKPKTKEQREQEKLKRAKRSARTQLNMAQKKLAKLTQQEEASKQPEPQLIGSGAYQPVEEQQDEILFEPNAGPQTDFWHHRSEKYYTAAQQGAVNLTL